MPERPDFIVHNPGDTVGVVVVEDARAGQELRGWVMEGDGELTVTANGRHPARAQGRRESPCVSGDTVIKYEHDIGKAVEPRSAVGDYVHAHNIKTKRW